jgi:hypothetical protein
VCGTFEGPDRTGGPGDAGRVRGRGNRLEPTTAPQARCSFCAGGPPLAPSGGPLSPLQCPQCRSAYLGSEAATRLRFAIRGFEAAPPNARNGRVVACPRCASSCAIEKAEHGHAASCTRCGGAFIDASLLAWAEAALATQPALVPAAPPRPPPAVVEPAPRPSSPASPPPAAPLAGAAGIGGAGEAGIGGPPADARIPKPLLAGGAFAVGLLVVLAVGFLLSGGRSKGPAVSETAWRDAPIARISAEKGGGASAAAPGGAAPAEAARKAAQPPSPERLFGGRPLDWWKDRLVRLRKGQSPLYEATLRAARANGLVAVEAGEDVTVSLGAQDAPGGEGR